MIVHNFIVLEGIDGSGTSTQMKIVSQQLPPDSVFFTCEPTELETGRFLRQILRAQTTVTPQTAAYLFAADRNEHLYGHNGILENIQQGKRVMCDRYIFSSLAYQSIECGFELPRLLNSTFPLPETVFFFDIDPALSLNRIQGREVTELYEKHDFLLKTADAYRAVFEEYEKKETGMKIVRIDASLPIEIITQKIVSEISI